MLKSRDITLLTKVYRVKAMVFPVVTYGYESWSIKKAEHQRMLLNCGVGKDTWESLGLQDQPSQSWSKSVLNVHWKYWCWSANNLTTWWEELQFSSVQFSRSVVSESLWPHESQHARPPCPSPSPGVHSNSHPLSRWCHPAISSSVIPFFSCPQSLPPSESFPMSQLFTWGGKSLLIRKDPDVGKDWRQKEKGMTEDEMVGWHHWLDRREFEQALGVGNRQGSLAYCRIRKESDTTARLNWTEQHGQNLKTLCLTKGRPKRTDVMIPLTWDV